MAVSPRYTRFLQLCGLLYVAVAVLYTTNRVLLSPTRAFLYTMLGTRESQASRMSPPAHSLSRTAGLHLNNTEPHSVRPSNADFPWPLEQSLSWNTSSYLSEYGLGLSGPSNMDEDLFLSKAFANSMRPSKIIPFFYRASERLDREDITITTLITSNRFQVFARLVERYQGLRHQVDAFTSFSLNYQSYRTDLRSNTCQGRHLTYQRVAGLSSGFVYLLSSNVPIRRCSSGG